MFRIFKKLIRDLSMLTNSKDQPNINSLWLAIKDIEILRLNSKNFGYQIARDLQQGFQYVDISNQPQKYGLVSKATTQADVESSWFLYWCNQIKAAPIYHRKLWEFAFLLQILHEHNLLTKDISGIGFGCGQEPLASFFASKQMQVTVSDLSLEQVVGKGWAETGQHATAKDQAYYPDIVDKETFDRNVSHKYIDMNKIPEFSEKFDFCWSVCAMEHLGSIEKGLAFVENSLSTLRPGGIAIHTTEFNYLSEEKTIDNWPTVLFRKKDFLELSKRLDKSGHKLLDPDFNVGDRVLDKFIDVPPYAVGEGWLSKDQWNDPKQSAHLKLAIDGFACTCFGIVVVKGPV